MARRPYIVVIGGPNGAGKSTIARSVVEQTFGMTEFVNADTIASGLSAFNPDAAAFAAGRVMLAHIHELAVARATFAFESTLSSRSFAPWLRDQAARGYDIHLLYVSLRSPRLAVARVRRRVKSGGHAVPEPIIRRRFHRSAANLFDLYLPIAHTWRIYDNSSSAPVLVAESDHEGQPSVLVPRLWSRLHEQASQAHEDK
ncbi:MAG: AAA family ATPase [Phycisphaerales bacterium]